MLNDDFVETDGGVHNVRVMNNRGVNAAHGGYSAQPVFGGPVYFIGNLLYHVPSRRGVQVLGQAGGAVRVSQHDHRRAGIARSLVQHALSQQPVSGPRHARPRHHDLGERHGCVQLRLQRLSPEQGSGRAIHLAGAESRAAFVRAKARATGRASRRWPNSARQRSRRRTASKSISTAFEQIGSARSRQPPRGLSRHGPELSA